MRRLFCNVAIDFIILKYVGRDFLLVFPFIVVVVTRQYSRNSFFTPKSPPSLPIGLLYNIFNAIVVGRRLLPFIIEWCIDS